MLPQAYHLSCNTTLLTRSEAVDGGVLTLQDITRSIMGVLKCAVSTPIFSCCSHYPALARTGPALATTGKTSAKRGVCAVSKPQSLQNDLYGFKCRSLSAALSTLSPLSAISNPMMPNTLPTTTSAPPIHSRYGAGQ